MRCNSSSSLILDQATYTESIDFADQFCVHRRHHTESIQRRSRFALLSTIRAESDQYDEYLQERQANVETFNELLTRPLRVDDQLSLDSFQLLRHLGKGGYGSVFLAYHRETRGMARFESNQKVRSGRDE